ncbi:MAG: vitamin B12-dependent ribonucleotide reductase [Bryobacteraceae bacterium]
MGQLAVEMSVNSAKKEFLNTTEDTTTPTTGVAFPRYFTSRLEPGRTPFDELRWEVRTASIANDKGVTIFEQRDVEVPVEWSQTATNIVASKYFHGKLGSPERERSVAQLVRRVVDSIASWGARGGYFRTPEDGENFRLDLAHLLLNQKASFNSPVWFNVGVEEARGYGWAYDESLRAVRRLDQGEVRPQCSACFIVSVRDSLESILDLAKTEGMLFKWGSGTGTNLSTLREEDAVLSGGGRASGPLSFMKGFDAFAGVIKSGGKTRRAAKMVILNAEHPDIEKFIAAKAKEEKKAHALVEAGYDSSLDGEAYSSVFFQNANNSVRATDAFMEAVVEGRDWYTKSVVDGQPVKFDVEAFRHAVDTMILAQEILVDSASYPTEKIAANSHQYRPLGLGFANLGAMLMALGIPYDSDQGRDYAGAVSAIMCGQAYLTSSRIAEAKGPFEAYPANEAAFLEVIRMHREAAARINRRNIPAALYQGAVDCWNSAYESGRRAGYRNAQVTVIAPTGTIGFMMDCDTTGIEPDLALVKYKKLVGGGTIKIVNNTVPQALIRLGYKPEQAEKVVAHIDSTGTIEGAPELKQEHLPVFDCSLRPVNGSRSIHYMGHLKMMAAVQPFISGAISKTINMPEESSVEDIMNAYLEGWRLGLKAVAIYRDNSKRVQPLNTGEQKKAAAAVTEKIVYRPVRRKLPDERRSLTHKFSIGGHEGYITVGMYDDGTPGELFITMAKEGSTISGLMDAFATAVSFNLQYGVPLKFLVEKFAHLRFEPSGWTGNPQLPYAKSIMDYIFRWLGVKFLGPEWGVTEAGDSHALKPTEPDPQQALPFDPVTPDAPLCAECGSIMTRNGACYKCGNCGGTSGCS